MATSAKIPTHIHEQQLAAERATENGCTIFTMWIMVLIIDKNYRDFRLNNTCKLILAKFSKFTNLAEMELKMGEDDVFFLDNMEVEIKTKYYDDKITFDSKTDFQPVRQMWKSYFQDLWESEIFRKFEKRYASQIVIPHVKMNEGNFLSISDNLCLLDEFTKFMKELQIGVTLVEHFKAIYNIAGLTNEEKTNLLQFGKKITDLKHQKDVLASKLLKTQKSAEIANKNANFNLSEEKKKCQMLQGLLEIQQEKNSRLEAEIAELNESLKALEQEAKKQGISGTPICQICQECAIAGPDIKLTSCCGHPIHSKCFDGLKIAVGNTTPPCPNCRNRGFLLCPLSGNHPLLRQPERKLMKDVEIGVCEADFLEDVIGGEDIAPIQSPPKSIYTSLLATHDKKDQKSQRSGRILSISLGR